MARKRNCLAALALSSTALLTACANASTFSEVNGIGPDPQLPQPETSLIPTVNVVEAVGWSGSERPVAAHGTTVTPFAQGLDHPRWLHVLPNGDVLVAETKCAAAPG